MSDLPGTLLGLLLMLAFGPVIVGIGWVVQKLWAAAESAVRLFHRLPRLSDRSMRLTILQEVAEDIKNKSGISLAEVYAVNSLVRTMYPELVAHPEPAETLRPARVEVHQLPDAEPRNPIGRAQPKPAVGPGTRRKLPEVLEGGWILLPDGSQELPWLRDLLGGGGKKG